MPQEAWSKKRERQYEHIKGSLKERGASEDKAEEIVAQHRAANPALMALPATDRAAAHAKS